MVISVGWKKTFFELVPRYPGLIVMPAFTIFTFGPVRSSVSCCYGDSFGHCRTGQLGLSFDLSWINIWISSAFMLFSELVFFQDLRTNFCQEGKLCIIFLKKEYCGDCILLLTGM